MLALASTRQGDIPVFCQALDGNASEKATLVAAVEALAEQLRANGDEQDDTEAPLFVADSGLYSAANVARLSAAGVRWISRVPDTSTEAKAALTVGDGCRRSPTVADGRRRSPTVADDAWQHDGDLFWASARQAPAGERWVVVRTTAGEERARATLQRQVDTTREQWEKARWHLSK